MSNIIKGLCANCGADEGLHHWKTFQCPAGGVEAPFGRKQEWTDRTFEAQIIDNKQKVVEALSKMYHFYYTERDKYDNDEFKDFISDVESLIPNHLR